MRLIDENIALELGGSTVLLRPTLKCALAITNAHGEPEQFVQQAHDGHFGLTRDILRHGIADRHERQQALDWLENDPMPLRWKFWLLRPHLVKFCFLLCGIDQDEPAPEDSKVSPVRVFAKAIAQYFEIATGVLHWSPDRAWNATPRGVAHALRGWARCQPGYEPDASERFEQSMSQTFDERGFSALKSMGR